MTERRSKILRIVAYCLAPITLLVALLSWSASSPVGSGADEDFHLASSWCGSGLRDGLCEAGSDDAHRHVPLQLIVASQCFTHLPGQSASCPATPSSVLTDTDRGNFVGVYPPVFYATMSIFAGTDISLSVLLMRAFNSLLYVVMMSLLFLLLPRARRGLLVWATLATLVPFGVFLIASVNPSGWGVLSASTLWLAILGFFEAETRGRQIGLAALALVSTVIGAGSRADSAAYAVVAIVLVGVLKAERTRAFVRRAVFPIALVALAGVGYLTSGQTRAVNLVGENISSPEGSVPGGWADLFWNNLIRLPELWAGAFGTPVAGRTPSLDAGAPGLVWFPVMLAFGGLVFLGLRRLSVRKGLSLAMIIGLLVLLPMVWLMRDHILVGQQVQSRYLYPLLIILAGVSLLGFRSASAGLGRVHMVLVATAAILSNLTIQWFTLRRFTTGLDVFWPNLDKNVEWWWGLPIGPMPLWIIGSIAFAIVCALAVLSAWRATDSSDSAERTAIRL
ncbi:DUF2142 domain-containing protein [Cryobacterium sp. RTS3]|uniref:DUF2142 domain-containing protein n=1 Tax=Cryobacterium sp. RTS3 TaxID=3048643 RepID=UPI002B229400|nr:DUF2142 domain-containing protein [Cryobacterium sp. RTS3]MEB0000581.1 DUF2142 domain-containing protein [Cryobacterium sp. RTS3]